jgi:hypothetical protein
MIIDIKSNSDDFKYMVGYTQVIWKYYAILHKELEYPQNLVFEGFRGIDPSYILYYFFFQHMHTCKKLYL